MDAWEQRQRTLAAELARIEEKIAAGVYDLAREIRVSGTDLQSLSNREVSDRLRARLSVLCCESRGIAENKVFLSAVDGGQLTSVLSLLCRILSQRIGLDKDPTLFSRLLEEEDEGGSVPEENRVIYLKNPYSDQAFLKFSGQIPLLCADYAQSFSQVCEAVFDGSVKYAILPLEDNRAGTIPAFRTLRRRHRLKVVMSCDIPSGEGEVTRFALLQASLPDAMVGMDEREDAYLRLTLPAGEDTPLCEILSLSQSCGFSLYKVDSIPASYADNEFYTELTLRGGGDIGAFLVYLQLFVPGFEIVGYYRNC